MNGTISLKSEKGKGSRFTIELPAGDYLEQVPKEHPLGRIVPKKTGEENQYQQTILYYIEDNNSNLKLVQKYLNEFASFNFMSSQSAVGGLDLARKHQPSLILMDINLPVMDGITAFKKF